MEGIRECWVCKLGKNWGELGGDVDGFIYKWGQLIEGGGGPSLPSTADVGSRAPLIHSPLVINIGSNIGS